jgi:hypothetical protein
MGQLLTLLWDICCLRRGPQDLPYSPPLLVVACIASLGLQLAIARVLGVDENTLGAGLLSLGFNFGVLYLLLNLRDKRSRFIQAATALLCCALLFTLLSLPIVLLVGERPPTPEQITPLQALLGLVSLPLLIWKVMVDAHILRHSLDVPFLAGIVIAVLWLIAELALGAVSGGAAPAT